LEHKLIQSSKITRQAKKGEIASFFPVAIAFYYI